MDIGKMLQELRLERENIDQVILGLERLAQGRGRGRGRPPAWMRGLDKKSEKRNSKKESKRAGPTAVTAAS